ncbi:MAG: PBP1A family penicillin-binding protein [Undibacterium sp.]|uniref:penicillin-binding protein 1A n=1 Tax=Undibacterium sp. TaxID=1914977 RepID=UPI00271AA8A8|nr:PBP1A family penicillin-binding protein [Undibacterium sp.]MDO8651109.1 PBP1A family penicillin-binding protein [Undibacterium sp.]
MKWLLSLAALIAVACAALFAFALLVLAPDLPSLDAVTDYKPKIPLRVYTADNALIGEFGEEHRDFVPIKEIPDVLKNALLAIEDSRFYEHGGIDFIGVTRALLSDVTGGVKQGASTITMQVARNFFLTRERSLSRKLKEIMLSYRIETALSKDQILELYMNQIYLGQRTHGFSSAARTYFGKSLKELSLAEAAMLAGVPQNPARHNPAVNPQRAKERQILVLKSMRRLGRITDAQYEQASAEPLHISSSLQFESHAAYVAEMVRQSIFEQYKEDSYTMGIKVYTTINKAEQEAAYESLRRNVMAYDQRHGYRGPEAFIELPAEEDARDDAIDEVLLKHPASDLLLAAVVTEVSPKLLKVELATGETIQISGDGLRFASAALQAKANRDLKLRPGAVIRVMQDSKGKRWQISQLPEVDAAYVSLNAQDGSYRALVGGFDFNRKKFNHVSSAWRQPGSAMKPFIYSAALEKGFFAGSMINDSLLSADTNEGLRWDPRNDDGKYDGPISMQTALAQSKNVVSVKILKAIGATYAHDYLPRFGFDAAKHPVNLTLALGTGSVTPVQLAAAYAVFANGGYQVNPWLIQKVTDGRGKLMFEAKVPAVAAEESRVIDARNAYIMDSMLREVTRSGTGAAASQRLGRHDLAGKTGTTSDAMDGWFAGYASNIVAVAWMGYDDPKSLGGREFGATLALPIWIDSMRSALAGKPEAIRATPENVVNVDGKWSYAEYQSAGGNGVITLDIEESFGDRLLKLFKP